MSYTTRRAKRAIRRNQARKRGPRSAPLRERVLLAEQERRDDQKARAES
jgi:hypothetical protein